MSELATELTLENNSTIQGQITIYQEKDGNPAFEINFIHIDNPFGSYLEMSKKQGLTIKKCSKLEMKYYMVFEYDSKHFLSTTYNYFYNKGLWLNIKLFIDNRIYENFFDGSQNDFCSYENEFCEKNLPKISEFLKSVLGQDCYIRLYYNYEHDRIEVKAFRKRSSALALSESESENKSYEIIVIKFERSSPYFDYENELKLLKTEK